MILPQKEIQLGHIRSRRRQDGSMAHAVIWRQGGTREGTQQTETFDTARDAHAFQREVDDAGQHWPDGWIKGRGYDLVGRRVPRARQSLRQYGEDFIDEITAIEPNQRARYLRQLIAIVDQLGEIMGEPPTIENVTARHVKQWVNRRWSNGRGELVATKTVANHHGLLYQVFYDAVNQQLRASNPCATTKLGSRRKLTAQKQDMAPLTEEALFVLLDCMYPDNLYIRRDLPLTMPRRSQDLLDICAGTRSDRNLVAVLVTTGMRWSEATALRVIDLDLDGTTAWGQGVARASISRAWKHNPPGKYHRDDLPTFYIGQPKSEKSKRKITLASHVVKILRDQIAGKSATDLVFTAPQGGQLHQATWYEDRWAPALDRMQELGYPERPRIRDLRHTHAIFLINAGVPLPVIQQRMGHDSIMITVDSYGGYLIQSHEVADAAMNDILGGKRIAHPGRGIPAAESHVADEDECLPAIDGLDDDAD